MNQMLGAFSGFKDATPEELAREVGEVGGIPFRRDVPLDFMTHDELDRYVSALLDDEYPESRARIDERTLVAFDLLTPDTRLRELRKRLLLENVIGFYDERPGKKRLYAVSSDRKLTPANQIILSHELRHALQDQYASVHDLLPDSVGDFDDRRLALLSVLEGDATLVMEKFMVHRMGIPGEMDVSGLSLPAPPVAGAPPILADQLVLPYVRGLEFVKALYERGGWNAVRDAWSKPPVSTEEILHPEEYLAHRSFSEVQIAYTPPSGRLLNDGVLGEVFIMTLLGPAAAPPEGWAGDRYRLYDVAGKSLLLWKSTWRSPGESSAMRTALVHRFLESHGAAETKEGAFLFHKAGWTVGIGGGSDVTYVASDDPRLAEQALHELR
jgi:hypothetical protein